MNPLLGKIAGAFSETEIDEEVVVMALASGDFFSLTGTAKAIWLLLDGTRSRAALLADLAAQFGCAEAEIAGDLDAFLADLGAAGLVAAS